MSLPPEGARRAVAVAKRAQAVAKRAEADALEAEAEALDHEPSPDGWIDLRAAETEFGVSARSLRAAISRDELAAVRADRHVRVRRADLAAFLESRRVRPRAPSGQLDAASAYQRLCGGAT